MTTRYDICSRALVRIGARPIASFDDDTDEARVAGREYEPLVETELSKRWRFATTQADLNRLSEAPLERWQHFWQLPGDLIVLNGIRAAGAQIPFDRYADRVACDASDDVVADYVFRVSEDRWPPLFREALTIRLEAIFWRGLKRASADAADADARADRKFAEARNSDAQQQTPRQVHASRLVSVRR